MKKRKSGGITCIYIYICTLYHIADSSTLFSMRIFVLFHNFYLLNEYV